MIYFSTEKSSSYWAGPGTASRLFACDSWNCGNHLFIEAQLPPWLGHLQGSADTQPQLLAQTTPPSQRLRLKATYHSTDLQPPSTNLSWQLNASYWASVFSLLKLHSILFSSLSSSRFSSSLIYSNSVIHKNLPKWLPTNTTILQLRQRTTLYLLILNTQVTILRISLLNPNTTTLTTSLQYQPPPTLQTILLQRDLQTHHPYLPSKPHLMIAYTPQEDLQISHTIARAR